MLFRSGPAYRPLLLKSPRSLPSKFVAVLALICVLYTARLFLPYDLPAFSLSRTRASCPPRDWAAGQWVPKPPPTNRTRLSRPEDAYEFLGLEGCASSREVFWHLAADAERLYDRFPGVASWAWQPPASCAIRALDPAVLVKDLVEHGGWFLIGGESPASSCCKQMFCLRLPVILR